MPTPISFPGSSLKTSTYPPESFFDKTHTCPIICPFPAPAFTPLQASTVYSRSSALLAHFSDYNRSR